MIEISISTELAAEHPRFMTECGGPGHRVEVFDSGDEAHTPAGVARGETEREVVVRDQAGRSGPGGRA